MLILLFQAFLGSPKLGILDHKPNEGGVILADPEKVKDEASHLDLSLVELKPGNTIFRFQFAA